MSAKDRAVELYNQHIALATTDGRLFRKTVMDTLMSETGCTLAAAATHYNSAKKLAAPVEGLGRPATPATVRKPTVTKHKGEELQEDDECFTVMELLTHEDGSITVGRNRSHLMHGDASEDFDEKIDYKPVNTWVMIKGLGPLYGETFKLSGREAEIKRYTPAVVAVVVKEAPLLIQEDDLEEEDI